MTTVVRVCEATYDATLVVKEGIQVLVGWIAALVLCVFWNGRKAGFVRTFGVEMRSQTNEENVNGKKEGGFSDGSRAEACFHPELVDGAPFPGQRFN